MGNTSSCRKTWTLLAIRLGALAVLPAIGLVLLLFFLPHDSSFNALSFIKFKIL
jgi:hypothetical protein